MQIRQPKKHRRSTGATDENFGSEPEIAFLDENGKFLAFEGDRIDFDRPIRLLMIYAVPKATGTIKLGYWGET